MKRILRSALVGTAVTTIGLSACDGGKPPEAPAQPPVASETTPEGESPVGAARKSLAEAVRDPDAFSRAKRLGSLLPTLPAEAIPAVQQTLEDPMIDLNAVELDLLLRFWADHQPDAAANWAKDKSPSAYRQVALYAAINAWAEDDPQAAAKATWNWVDDSANEFTVPTALVRGWYGRNEPTELRRFLRSRPPGFPGQRATATYVRLMIQNEGPQALRQWAESLPDDDEGFKLTVFRRSVLTLANLDKEAAKSWCEAHCNGPYGQSMRTLIGRSWVLGDGPGTFAWLASAPEGYDRDVAIRSTFLAWVQLDTEAAMRWMAEQTKGTPPAWLEPTYLIFARVLARDKPEEAMQWAGRVKKAQDREETLVVVARLWRLKDEAAAEQWLLQSPLSEEDREKARQPIKPQQLW